MEIIDECSVFYDAQGNWWVYPPLKPAFDVRFVKINDDGSGSVIDLDNKCPG